MAKHSSSFCAPPNPEGLQIYGEGFSLIPKILQQKIAPELLYVCATRDNYDGNGRIEPTYSFIDGERGKNWIIIPETTCNSVEAVLRERGSELKSIGGIFQDSKQFHFNKCLVRFNSRYLDLLKETQKFIGISRESGVAGLEGAIIMLGLPSPFT